MDAAWVGIWLSAVGVFGGFLGWLLRGYMEWKNIQPIAIAREGRIQIVNRLDEKLTVHKLSGPLTAWFGDYHPANKRQDPQKLFENTPKMVEWIIPPSSVREFTFEVGSTPNGSDIELEVSSALLTFRRKKVILKPEAHYLGD